MTSFGFGPAGGPALEVQAELALDIDGRAASIIGSGDRLVMHLDSPGHALYAMRGLTSSATVGALATALRATGLRLDVEGAHGRLLSLGAGVDSVLGRWGTGSRAVSTGSPRALAYLSAQVLRRAVGRRYIASAAGVALAVLVATTLRSVVRRQLGQQ